MQPQDPIGILDSGVGGLTALRVVKQLLPFENIIYFGDSKNMPYGNRSPEEIVRLSNAMIDFLEARHVKTILLACNTISSNIDRLESQRKLFSIVECGAKFALTLNKNEPLGIIATRATVKSQAYETAIKRLRGDVKLSVNDSTILPKIINNDLKNTQKLNASIKACIDPILRTNPRIQKLILGCSHFPIITSEIQQLYPSLTLLDPSEIMAKDLRTYLQCHALLNAAGPSKTELYTTADTFECAAAIERLELEIDKLEKVTL